jgi:hypothetical protein
MSERIELLRAAHFLLRLVEAAGSGQQIGVPLVRLGIPGVERDGAEETPFGLLEVPVVIERRVAQGCVGGGVVRVELQRAPRRDLRPGKGFRGREVIVKAEHRIGVREPHPRRCVVR